MPFLKALTLEQAVALIEDLDDEEYEAVDVAILPPENNADSDVDEIDEDEVGNIPDVRDVPGTLEIRTSPSNMNTDEPNQETKNDNEANPCQLEWIEAADPVWQKSMRPYTRLSSEENHHDRKLAAMKEELDGLSPIELFEKMFDNRCVDLLVTETNRYAAQKNETSFHVQPSEIKAFVGILLLTGYHRLPSQDHYWSLDPDLQVPLVRECMPVKAFLTIKRFFHCNDNDLLVDPKNKTDKSFKVKPLFDILNENFKRFGFFSKCLSIDEMIIKYFGHHGLKQFIRGKPIRFGYKLWAMCSDNGYVYDFFLYQGKETNDNLCKVPLGGRVVLQLASKIDHPEGKELFFDNLFTSHSLLVTLTKMGFRATGTIRANRTKKAPFSTDKEMRQRGSIDQTFDKTNQLLFVKWNDNNFVHIATNYSSVEPKAKITRYSRTDKKKIEVEMPRAIAEYNQHMGGVDHHDWLASHYAIGIRSKKWYFPLLIRGIQMALVNAWIIHREIVDKKEQISLLAFTRKVAVSYMKLTHGQPSVLSRRRASHIKGVTRLTADFRFDGMDHHLLMRSNQRRCQGQNCGARPLSYCGKCDITLCKRCFIPYHRR